MVWRGEGGRFFAVMNTGKKKVRVRLSGVFRPGVLKRNARVYPSQALGMEPKWGRAGQTAVLRPREIVAGWIL